MRHILAVMHVVTQVTLITGDANKNAFRSTLYKVCWGHASSVAVYPLIQKGANKICTRNAVNGDRPLQLQITGFAYTKLATDLLAPSNTRPKQGNRDTQSLGSGD